eukprot:scaffold49056_cov69-Phaeocystis_antarctica.AAC.3
MSSLSLSRSQLLGDSAAGTARRTHVWKGVTPRAARNLNQASAMHASRHATRHATRHASRHATHFRVGRVHRPSASPNPNPHPHPHPHPNPTPSTDHLPHVRGSRLVGRRVEIWWDGDLCFYPATVRHHLNPNPNMNPNPNINPNPNP